MSSAPELPIVFRTIVYEARAADFIDEKVCAESDFAKQWDAIEFEICKATIPALTLRAPGTCEGSRDSSAAPQAREFGQITVSLSTFEHVVVIHDIFISVTEALPDDGFRRKDY